jgi:hypothetical protein
MLQGAATSNRTNDMKAQSLPSLSSAAAFAQTAEIRGEVTDPSGASIPGATATATGPGGVKREASTDEQAANMTQPPAGVYRSRHSLRLQLRKPAMSMQRPAVPWREE